MAVPDPRGRSIGSMPELIGRNDEFARLDHALTQDRLAVLVVTGGIGVGKSHLCTRLLERATQRGRTVEMTVATEAGASIPFGAFARLLPYPLAAPGEQLPYLQRALAHLTDVLGGERGVLAIDDAHLLDPASATLAHQLTQTNACALLLTRRAGEPVPDAITEVEKKANQRVRLRPLTRSATRQLVARYLNAPACERLHAAAWDVSRGNPLYLRELLLDARDEGRIEYVGQLWDLATSLKPGERLRELVAGRLRRLRPHEREALEFLAIGEPLEIDILLDHIGTGTVDGLVRRGFIDVAPAGHRRVASLTHPVYREALRLGTPQPRARQVCAALAESLASRGTRRRDDVLRLATWQLEAGRSGEADTLTEAARWALAVFDYQLAERLARIAAEKGGFESELALAEALSHQLRVDEAERQFETASKLARRGEERLRLAATRAEHLFFRAGRAHEAINLLRMTLAKEEPPAAIEDRIRATLAVFAAVQGDLPTASEAGRRVLGREQISPDLLVRTLFVSTLADAMLGNFTRAHHGVRVGLRHTDDVRREIPLAEDILRINDIAAYTYAGELLRAHALAEAGRRQALEADALDAVGAWSWVLLEVLLLRGGIAAATRVAAGTLPILEHRDPLRIRPSLLAVSVMIHAMASGNAPNDLLEQCEALEAGGDARVITLRARARAWQSALRDRPRAAVDKALQAGAVGEQQTQLAWAALAYHDAVRFGGAEGAVVPLAQLANAMEGELIDALAGHARSVAERDPDGLQEVSRQFENLGADLYAAESSAHAARLYRRVRPDLARRAGARARAMARRCSGAMTPALRGLGGEDLTHRELQVAQLAADGLRSQEIADRLTVSRRTVDNNLGSVYRKLGISSRAELPYALGADTSAR